MTALTHKENDLHNRLIVAEFNLAQVEEELRRLHEENEALRARLDGWERVNMHDHKEGDLGIGTVKWDASAPLVMHPHPAFQTTEPQREWQGLTDEERYLNEARSAEEIEYAKAIEAKLKEKNNG